MATFSPKNFPKDVPGNNTFSGIGERTIYAPVSKSMYKYDKGFHTDKATSMYDTSGKAKQQLTKGKTVYFTYPAKLLTGQQLNITGGSARSTFVGVSLTSWKSKVDGYVVLSHIAKPGGGAQNRVAAGSKTQDMCAEAVMKLAYKQKIEVSEQYKTARPGSTAPDLEMTIGKAGAQFEIKGTNSRTAPITFFDKSASRSKAVPKLLDEIAVEFVKTLRKDGATLDKTMESMGYPISFIGAIDYFKSIDKTIGLAGDAGTPASGKLPAEFTTTDTTILKKLHKKILEHFKEGGDNYFAIHNRTLDTFEIYYVGKGNNGSGNKLKLPTLPNFKSFSLATYGGASSGSTRCGLKIKL